MKNRILKERVRNGIRFLDNGGYPNKDWASKIDTKELDLEADDTCVMGQLFGSYNAMDDAYGTEKLIGLGFNLKSGEDQKEKNWKKLNFIWAEKIKKRMNGIPK